MLACTLCTLGSVDWRRKKKIVKVWWACESKTRMYCKQSEHTTSRRLLISESACSVCPTTPPYAEIDIVVSPIDNSTRIQCIIPYTFGNNRVWHKNSFHFSSFFSFLEFRSFWARVHRNAYVDEFHSHTAIVLAGANTRTQSATTHTKQPAQSRTPRASTCDINADWMNLIECVPLFTPVNGRVLIFIATTIRLIARATSAVPSEDISQVHVDRNIFIRLQQQRKKETIDWILVCICATQEYFSATKITSAADDDDGKSPNSQWINKRLYLFINCQCSARNNKQIVAQNGTHR